MLTEKVANGLKILIQKGKVCQWVILWYFGQWLGGENGPSWTSSIYNTKAVCTGGLGINIYSVAYPYILQGIMQVLYVIILCSIKETNLEEKKLNYKSIIASKLQIIWHVMITPRMVWIKLHFPYSQQRTHHQFIAGAKVFNVTSPLRDSKKGAFL